MLTNKNKKKINPISSFGHSNTVLKSPFIETSKIKKSKKDFLRVLKHEKTVFVSGNFNILHPGHLRLLKYAKGLCGKLLVGVYSDKKAGESAHLNQDLRLEGIKSNIWVDEAFIIDEPVENIIKSFKPQFVVKGKEHEGKYNPEENVLGSYGGKLVFCSGDASFSSSYLIKQNLLNETDNKNLNLPDEYIKRHKLNYNDLNNYVKSFRKLKVCVIGDLIVDEYIDCKPLGMSQEDPTLVVSPENRKRFLGGAGIVAAHSSSLGADTSFISVLGKDSINSFVKKELKKFGVKSFIIIDESRPTSLKQRFRADSKTLLRVSNLHQNSINKIIQKNIIEFFSNINNNFDLIVFSDFNYGCLTNDLIKEITKIGKDRNSIMVADSQSSSQIGDITKFKNMDLLTPTENEIRVSLKNNEDGLVVLAEKLRENSRAKNIFLKLGADGVLLHLFDKITKAYTDRMPALNDSPRDVAGAGDSMLISSALSLAVGSTAIEAACIGSIAASVQISRVGNIPLCPKDLLIKNP